MALAVTAWSPVIIRTSIPAPSAVVDRALGLDSERIDDADHADEIEVLRERHRIRTHRVELVVVDEARREREHPQTLFPHPLVGGVDVGPRVVDRDVRLAHRTAGTRAPRQDDVGTALHQLHDPLASGERRAVEGRHELVLGVEGHLGEPRVAPARLFGVDVELGRQHHQRRLGRIADDRPVVGDRRVAVEHHTESQVGEVRHRNAGDRLDGARLAVPLALDREPRAVRVDRPTPSSGSSSGCRSCRC